MGSKTLGGFALPAANLLVQAICVLLTLASDSPSCLSSAVLVLAVPLWARHLCDDYRPPTERTGKSQSFRLCALIYGIGQILGPALTSMLGNEHRRLPAPLSAARRRCLLLRYQHSAII